MVDTAQLKAKERECQSVREELAKLEEDTADDPDFEFKEDAKLAYNAEKKRLRADLRRGEGEVHTLLAEYERDEANRKAEAALAEARAQARWTKWLAILAVLSIIVSTVALLSR